MTYARNLTPDMETGIGKYTADDIVRALRTGRRLDGSPMLPPMPWPNAAQMSDEDIQAVAAYLKSLPAVSHKVPERLQPGSKAPAKLTFPPPPAWDAKNLPAPASPAPGGGQESSSPCARDLGSAPNEIARSLTGRSRFGGRARSAIQEGSNPTGLGAFRALPTHGGRGFSNPALRARRRLFENSLAPDLDGALTIIPQGPFPEVPGRVFAAN